MAGFCLTRTDQLCDLNLTNLTSLALLGDSTNLEMLTDGDEEGSLVSTVFSGGRPWRPGGV